MRGESYFVIVGLTIADATGKYHELVAAGDERVKNTRIRVAVAHTARRHLEGLRVHGYVFSDRALAHPYSADLLETLERSVVLGNYRNNPTTGEQ